MILPWRVKLFLRPYYNRVFRTESERTLVTRNWSFDIDVNKSEQEAFNKITLHGDLNHRIEGEGKNFLLCAQPKSASLYLTSLLANTLNLVNHQVGLNNQGGTLYLPRLVAAKFVQGDTISHCHAIPDPDLITIIKNLDLRIVVLFRNLLDALVSRRDMLLRDKWAPNILSTVAIENLVKSSEETKLDIVIQLFAAEYVNFFSAWDGYRTDKDINPIFVDYEDVRNAESTIVQRIAKGNGLVVEAAMIDAVSRRIKKAGGINYSKGITGRGLETFTLDQIKEIARIARMFACTDQSFLGFDPSDYLD